MSTTSGVSALAVSLPICYGALPSAVVDDRLVKLYLFLAAGILTGILLGRWQGPKLAPLLGNFLFWIGAPFTIVVFMQGVNLSGWVWLAPLVSWVVMGLGILLAWIWLQSSRLSSNQPPWPSASRGSFLLAAMAGNTGYLGYPIVLALAGQEHFPLALFYDLLGTAVGTYGLGVAIAAYYGGQVQSRGQLVYSLLKNPPLWSFLLGFLLRAYPFTPPMLEGLQGLAWGVIFSSLVLIGLRLSQVTHGQAWSKVLPSLAIKMLLLPLLAGLILSGLGVTGLPRLVLVLQIAMPPAFSTLVLAEVYQLDRDLSVTTLVVGSASLLVLLPLWLALFGP